MKIIIALFILLTLETPAFAWSLFPPKDYEECKVQAAKEASNRDSLGILLRQCRTDFPANKKPEGGYEYYDSISNQHIDVSAPKLSKDDWENVKKARQRFAEQEAQRVKEETKPRLTREEYIEREINRRLARDLVSVVEWRIECSGQFICIEKTITATIKNNSKYVITAVNVGWILSTKAIECNSVLKTTAKTDIRIAPSQQATLSWKTQDGASSSSLTGCLSITNVNIEHHK